MNGKALIGSGRIKTRQILPRRVGYADNLIRAGHHQLEDEIGRQGCPPADLFGNGFEIKIVNKGETPFAAEGTSERIGVKQHINAMLAAKRGQHGGLMHHVKNHDAGPRSLDKLQSAVAQAFWQLRPRPRRAQNIIVTCLLQQPLQQAEGDAGDTGSLAAILARHVYENAHPGPSACRHCLFLSITERKLTLPPPAARKRTCRFPPARNVGSHPPSPFAPAFPPEPDRTGRGRALRPAQMALPAAREGPFRRHG
ncbi:hypothetical protein D3C71_1213510 [compost metagenome]